MPLYTIQYPMILVIIYNVANNTIHMSTSKKQDTNNWSVEQLEYERIFD